MSQDAILLVCTANQCRSPMAEAMLRACLGEQNPIDVGSAGFLDDGTPCPEDVLVVMDELDLDLAQHRSRRVTSEIVSNATLIVTMARQHAIDLVVEFPVAWERTFTVTDLLERSSVAGGRAPGETFEAWVARINGGRQRSDLLRLPSSGDIPDPIGRSLREYRQTRDRLLEFTRTLTELVSTADR